MSVCYLTDSGKELYKIANIMTKEKVEKFCKHILLSQVIDGLHEIHYYDGDNKIMIDEIHTLSTKVTI